MARKDQVLALLRERGPMTALRVEAVYPGAAQLIRETRSRTPNQAFCVVGYEQRMGYKSVPMYSAEGGEDVERPVRARGRNPVNRPAVLALLKAHGPMSIFDIAKAMDWPESRAQNTIVEGRKLKPPLFRVARYCESVDGKKGAPLFAAEGGEDALYVPKKIERNPGKNRLRTGFWAGLGG